VAPLCFRSSAGAQPSVCRMRGALTRTPAIRAARQDMNIFCSPWHVNLPAELTPNEPRLRLPCTSLQPLQTLAAGAAYMRESRLSSWHARCAAEGINR
jgi:hypothetical protein